MLILPKDLAQVRGSRDLGPKPQGPLGSAQALESLSRAQVCLLSALPVDRGCQKSPLHLYSVLMSHHGPGMDRHGALGNQVSPSINNNHYCDSHLSHTEHFLSSCQHLPGSSGHVTLCFKHSFP